MNDAEYESLREILLLGRLMKITKDSSMASGQDSGGLPDKPPQWTSNFSMSDSPVVGGIPKAWLNAEEALQKVQHSRKDNTSLPATSSQNQNANVSSSSSSSSSSSNNNNTSSSNMYNYSYPYWSQMYGYSGYPAVTNYGGYYNMAYQNMAAYGAAYYGYPTVNASSQASVVQNQSSNTSNSNTASSNSDKTPPTSVALSELATQPPPPPPTPPPNTDTIRNPFPVQRSKQAPGTTGIRFTMPKRQTPKGNNSLLDFGKKKGRNRKGGKFGNQRNNSSFGCFSSPQQYSSDPKDSEKEPFENLGFDISDTVDWPPTLKEYLSQCYSNCTTQLQKDRMAIILKGKLGQLLKNGTLWDKDWTLEPIVSLSDQSQKEQQVFNGPEKIHNTSRLGPSIPKHLLGRQKNSYKAPPRLRSRSRSHSRSVSPYPRRVIRRKERSSSNSSSSSSSSSNSGFRKQSICSSIVTPMELSSSSKGSNNSRSTNKKKKNKKKVLSYTVEPEEYAENQVRLQRRAARFKPAAGKKGGSLLLTVNNLMSGGIDDESDIDWSSYAIVGTCTDIEKPFLRITSAVDPAAIRPLEVLEKSLAMVKEHWGKNHDYHFSCEQMKSIRQDLVVQCIRNSFTIQTYEMHARIALEKGDHTEFNQCQSQLKVLYEELNEGNKEEFTAYRILYNMYTNDTREIKNIISTLSAEDKLDEVISHALALNLAWTLNNFHCFFKLYITAPKMAGFIIDWFAPSVRKTALKAYVKSYRPTLPVEFVQRELGFSSIEECHAFLAEYNLVFTADKSSILCKESLPSIAA